MKKLMGAASCYFATKRIAIYFFVALCLHLVTIQANIFQTEAITSAMEHVDELGQYLIPVICWMSISCVTMPMSSYLRHRANASAYTAMNNKFVHRVAAVPYDTFVRTSCSNMITLSEQMFSNCNVMINTFQCIICTANVVLLLVAIWRISHLLIPVILVIYTIIALGSRKLFGIYCKNHAEISRGKKQRNREIDELINGFSEVRTFNMSKMHVDLIGTMNQNNLDMMQKNHRLGTGTDIFINAGNLCAIVLGIIYVAKEISAGTVTVAVGMALVMYLKQVVSPIINFLDQLDEFAEDLAKLDDFLAFMNLPDDTDGKTELVSFDNNITIIDMSFAYAKSDTVLSNVNLTIRKGESIGICGESGGGKTTLLKLLEKLYAPTEGCITIDGIDLRKLTNESIRAKMGIVSQDVYIFDKTIYENVQYGSPDATEYEIIEACKKASLYDFIIGLPDGFHTQVGPRGLKLSGGQKQRISLARIFLRDPEIILLDEATAALDNESERIVQQSLEAFSDKTIITIAHRLTTIKNCDRIIVLENHRIVESGTHSELIKRNGAYARLYNAHELEKGY